MPECIPISGRAGKPPDKFESGEIDVNGHVTVKKNSGRGRSKKSSRKLDKNEQPRNSETKSKGDKSKNRKSECDIINSNIVICIYNKK